MVTTLQKNVRVIQRLPENSACVLDGMNLVQRVKGDQPTFGHVDAMVLAMPLKEAGQSDRIDVVFDTYQEISTKNSERAARGEAVGHNLQGITHTQIVRQSRSFLTKARNKTNLFAFTVSKWKKKEDREKLQKEILYVTIYDKCYKIAHQDIRTCCSCCQREGYQAVIICSEDTDDEETS